MVTTWQHSMHTLQLHEADAHMRRLSKVPDQSIDHGISLVAVDGCGMDMGRLVNSDQDFVFI